MEEEKKLIDASENFMSEMSSGFDNLPRTSQQSHRPSLSQSIDTTMKRSNTQSMKIPKLEIDKVRESRSSPKARKSETFIEST
jgi:hypothetical protein